MPIPLAAVRTGRCLPLPALIPLLLILIASSGCEGVLCAYDAGRVEHGPATSGCLIGQAGRRQPELWRLLCSEPREQIDQILCDSLLGPFSPTDDEMMWLEHLQSWQDAGETWSAAFCRAHGLTYVRHADSKYEFDAVNVWWSPQIQERYGEPLQGYATQNGQPLIEVERVKDLLEHSGQPVRDTLRMLEDATPVTVPPLTVRVENPQGR